MMHLLLQARQAAQSGTGTDGPLPPDVNRGGALLAGFVVYTTVAFVTVALRFWARYRIRSLSWDDWLMLFAWFLLLVTCALVGVIATAGGFRHLAYLTSDPSNLTKVLELMNIALAFAVAGMAASKISVALLQLRLLRGASFWQPAFLRGVVLLTTAYTIANLTLAFAQCSPPSALWDLSPDAASHCLPAATVADCSIFFGSLGALVDFTLALLPVTYVWALNQPLRTRLSLMAVLGAGAFSGVCGAVKTYYLGNFAAGDLTWNLYDAWLWAGADIFLVILCGSIPALKPLWESCLSSSSSGRNSKRSRPTMYGGSGGGGVGGLGGNNPGGGVGGKYIRSASSGRGMRRPYEMSVLAGAEGGMTVDVVGAAAKISGEQSSITPITVVETAAAANSNEAIRVTQTIDLDWDAKPRRATDVV